MNQKKKSFSKLKVTADGIIRHQKSFPESH